VKKITMAIPDYQMIMLPLLGLLSDGKTHKFRDLVEGMVAHFKLTSQERDKLLPSGRTTVFYDRVHWAKTYLKKAGLVKSEKRAFVEITQRGRNFLKSKPKELNAKTLEQFEEFREFVSPKPGDGGKPVIPVDIETRQTPEELLQYSYQELRVNLAQDVLEQVKSCSPKFFENLVVDLLTRMGYGGSRRDAGEAIGGKGDGGVDGIIKEDKLGLDAIYIQAKRWEMPVPVKEVRDFAGSLLAKKARKGIFITTSSFPHSAYDFVKNIEHRIILIDGKMLADLMIEHNVGLSVQNVFEIKRIDSDYFSEE